MCTQRYIWESVPSYSWPAYCQQQPLSRKLSLLLHDRKTHTHTYWQRGRWLCVGFILSENLIHLYYFKEALSLPLIITMSNQHHALQILSELSVTAPRKCGPCWECTVTATIKLINCWLGQYRNFTEKLICDFYRGLNSWKCSEAIS